LEVIVEPIFVLLFYTMTGCWSWWVIWNFHTTRLYSA